MLELTAVSERRACRAAGLSRDAYRHPLEPPIATRALLARVIELAQIRRRVAIAAGTIFCARGFPNVNHKKVSAVPRGEASYAPAQENAAPA